MHLGRVWFAAAFLYTSGWFCPAARAQTAPSPATHPPTFEANVRVVLVHVVVTDRKGDGVTGLRPADFEVLEDGKRQTISSFEEHRGLPATPTRLPEMPPGTFTDYPTIATAESVTVLLLDTLNSSVLDQAFVRQQMLAYLKTIPPGTRIAIFALGSRLRMLQEFTSDTTALLAALTDKKNSNGTHSPLLQAQGERADIQSSIEFKENERMGPKPEGFTAELVDGPTVLSEMMADVAVRLVEQRVAITILGLQQLGRYLSGFPGRKNVIWLSASFPLRFTPDASSPNPFRTMRDFQEEIQKTSDLLTEAQVAVYPVTAQGLTGESAYEANAAAIGVGNGRNFTKAQIGRLQGGMDDRENRRFTMEELAKDTGGQAFVNTNGLDDVLAHITKGGMRYYSLSYTPSNKNADGKYRHISVNLTKEKYKLSYRRGYYATAREIPSRKEPLGDPLLPLIAFASPDYSQVLFKLHAGLAGVQPTADAARAGVNAKLAGPIARYDFDFAIAPDDLQFQVRDDGTRACSLEVRVVAYDSAGKPLNMAGRRHNIFLRPAELARVRSVGLQLHEQLDIPENNDIHLRAGIYDLNSGRAGTVSLAARLIPRTPKRSQ